MAAALKNLDPNEFYLMDDIIEMIMMRCDSKTITECANVCERFQKCSYFTSLWKHNFKINGGKDLTRLLPFLIRKGVRRITLGCEHPKRFDHLKNTGMDMTIYKQFMHDYCDNLESLILDSSIGLQSSQCNKGFVYPMPNLTKLVIQASMCNGETLERLITNCRQLTHFETGPTSDNIPEENLVKFAKAFPYMQILKLGNASRIGNKAAESISQNMILLKEFEIKKCSISNEGLGYLFDLERLESLSMEFSDITAEGIKHLEKGVARNFLQKLQIFLYEDIDTFCVNLADTKAKFLKLLSLGSQITPMSDRGIMALRGLPSHLEKFRLLGGNDTTEFGRRAFIDKFLTLDTFIIGRFEVELPASYPKRKKDFIMDRSWEDLL